MKKIMNLGYADQTVLLPVRQTSPWDVCLHSILRHDGKYKIYNKLMNQDIY